MAYGYLYMINMDDDRMDIQLIDNKVQSAIIAVVTHVAGHALCQDDLKDLVQDVNIKVLTHKFDAARGSIVGWACSIAQNVAIDALRKHSRRITIPQIADQSAPELQETDFIDYISDSALPCHHNDAANKIISTISSFQLSERVLNVLCKLKLDDQEFIMQFISEDYNIEAYAQKIGTTPVALRVRKHRLIERLQQMLSEVEY